MRRKHVGITVAGLIVLLGVIGFVYMQKTPNTKVSDNTVSGNSTTLTLNETETVQDNDTTPTVDLNEDFTPDDVVVFVYDKDESEESYLKADTAIIEGRGTVREPDTSGATGSTGSGTGTTVSTTESAQRYWSLAAKQDDYMWTLDTFKVVPSVKYDISVQALIGNYAIMNAPNNTEVKITELNSSSGDATYWREEELRSLSLGYYDLIIPDCSIPYNTQYILGTGLQDWSPYEMYNLEDITVQDSIQIVCDTEESSNFGEGYYFEVYDSNTGCYYGYYLCQHGSRVYLSVGCSEYRDTIHDIVLATTDRCIVIK